MCARRNIGGVWFRCLTPGNWLSEDGTLAAMHMMAGTSVAAWELYLTQFAKGCVRRIPRDPDTVEFLCADHWCSAYTFGELASDIAKLADWCHNLGRNLAEVCKRQDQDRRRGFGPPDPSLGWYPYEHGLRAKQPSLPAGAATIRWKRSTGDFVDSHCGRWHITPIYGGLTRPESYELWRGTKDWKRVGSGQTQRECKEDAERMVERGA